MTLLGNSGFPIPPVCSIGVLEGCQQRLVDKALTIPDLEFSTWETRDLNPILRKPEHGTQSLSTEGSEGLCCNVAVLAPLTSSHEDMRARQ